MWVAARRPNVSSISQERGNTGPGDLAFATFRRTVDAGVETRSESNKGHGSVYAPPPEMHEALHERSRCARDQGRREAFGEVVTFSLNRKGRDASLVARVNARIERCVASFPLSTELGEEVLALRQRTSEAGGWRSTLLQAARLKRASREGVNTNIGTRGSSIVCRHDHL